VRHRPRSHQSELRCAVARWPEPLGVNHVRRTDPAPVCSSAKVRSVGVGISPQVSAHVSPAGGTVGRSHPG